MSEANPSSFRKPAPSRERPPAAGKMRWLPDGWRLPRRGMPGIGISWSDRERISCSGARFLDGKSTKGYRVNEASSGSYTIGNEKLCRVSQAAAAQLSRLLQEAGKAGGALRIAVVGGGCSGLQYQMDLVDRPREKDILIDAGEARLVVDPKSALFLAGSVLDYSEDLQSRGFVVRNPNASSHCSCGKSFAV